MYAFGAVSPKFASMPTLGRSRFREWSLLRCREDPECENRPQPVLGGMVWGIGMALHEHDAYGSRSGRYVNSISPSITSR